MQLITLPEKCVKLELRKNYYSSFYVNKENLLVHRLDDYLTYLLELMKKQIGTLKKDHTFLPQRVEASWLNKYYDIIDKKESSIDSRFLGKEFLYRRILIHSLFPQKDLFGKDQFLKRLLKDKDFPFVSKVLDIIEKYKSSIVFISRHFKLIHKTKKFTPLEFHKLMVITFPFEINSYKFWIENILLYNIHKEFNIV